MLACHAIVHDNKLQFAASSSSSLQKSPGLASSYRHSDDLARFMHLSRCYQTMA